MSSDSCNGLSDSCSATLRAMERQGDIHWQDASTTAARAVLRLRQENNWTREDVAHATGLKSHTARRWELGLSAPPDDRVADALRRAGVPPESLPEWGIDSPAVLARVGGTIGEPTGGDVRLDEPPAWAQDILDELHALRQEVQRCHDIERDAS